MTSKEETQKHKDLSELVQMYKNEIQNVLPWERIQNYIKKGDSVTELFSGSAEASLIGFASLVGMEGRVLAVDYQNYPSEFLPENTTRVRNKIPFLKDIPDTSQDVVYISQFQWAYAVALDDNEKELVGEEILRILKDGAKLIIKDRNDARYFQSNGRNYEKIIEDIFGEKMHLVEKISFGDNSSVAIYGKS